MLRILLTSAIVSLLATAAIAEQRIALVIGNSAYPEAPLRNPANDARDITARLTALGFEVVSATDTDLATMQRQVLEFIDRIQPGATAMVYYAGHGIQANGRNYLLPVDASFESEGSLRFEALEVYDILEELEDSPSRINLLVLDACRNNPFERKVRGGGRGLAAIDAAAGSFIAYATAPGSVASDGVGDNGLYTEALLDALTLPGLQVEDVFKRVRIRVAEESNGMQIPWESSSLTADFVFNPAAEPEPVIGKPVPEAVAEEEQGGNGGICDDMSGNWVSRSEATKCDSRYTLKKVGPDTYEMEFRACNVPVLNKVTGTLIVDGRTTTARWKGLGCTGVTTMTLEPNCRSASGEAVFNPSLTCKGTYAESVYFMGE